MHVILNEQVTCVSKSPTWLLQVPRIRSAAVSQVANSLAWTYQLVHDSLSDPSCGYDPDAAARTASPEEIRTIVGIL